MVSESRRRAIRRQYRNWRNDIEKSQLEVQALARLDAGRYWKIENGIIFPTEKERAALARVLKVSESDLPTEELVEVRA